MSGEVSESSHLLGGELRRHQASGQLLPSYAALGLRTSSSSSASSSSSSGVGSNNRVSPHTTMSSNVFTHTSVVSSSSSTIDPSILPNLGSIGKRFKSMPDIDALVKSCEETTAIPAADSFSSGIRRTNSDYKLQNVLDNSYRRVQYLELPMISTFGLHSKEANLKREFSSVSLTALNIAGSSSSINHSNNSNNNVSSEIDPDEVIMTIPLIMAVFVAIIAQFLIGYNTSVMNNPADVVFPGHSTTEWSLVVSAFAIGGPFGSMWGGKLANMQGRRGAMLINTWIFLIGGLLLTFAPNIPVLVLARLIIGVASGVSSVVVPVYLGEIAPPALRGTLGTCTQFALVIGILASDIFAFPLANAKYWRYLFAITPFLCCLQLFSSSFLLESPRWLLSHNNDSFEARRVIKMFRGFRNEMDVNQEVENFIFADNRHKTSHQSAHSAGAIMDLLFSKELRVLVISSIVLQLAQQLCGINAVFYYSTSFFKGRIDNPLLGTTLVALVNVIATYVALLIMDTTRRRKLLLISAGGMLISTIFIIAALLDMLPNSVALISVMAFVSFFELGLGPIPWLIVAEMFDNKYVSTAMSISCMVNWGCNFLVGFTFPFINSYLGPWSFAPFGIVLVLVCAFTYWYLPETYNKTVEEIQKDIAPIDDEQEVVSYRIIGAVDF